MVLGDPESVLSGETTTRPDPSRMTTSQLLREIANIRELIEGRINSTTDILQGQIEAHSKSDEIFHSIIDKRLDISIRDVKEIIETRLAGMDKALALQMANSEQRILTAAALAKESVKDLQVLLEQKIDSAESQTSSLDRVVQTRLAGSETALNAAMAAADKVTQKIEINFGAVLNEMKAGVAKQIDNLNEKIVDINKRVFESGGRSEGIGWMAVTGISAIVAVAAVITLVMVLSRDGHDAAQTRPISLNARNVINDYDRRI